MGKREDGFHNIASVMQTVSLYDTLTFSPAPEIRVRVEAPELDTPDNLVHRAATLLKSEARVDAGADILLAKEIPLAAGLGGGSSDAAVTLLGLNALWGLEMTHERLAALAERLGSDVPFFLTGGAALVEGRGERVTPIPAPPRLGLLLAFPDIRVENKTAAAYRSFTPADYRDGAMTSALVARIRVRRTGQQ